MAVIDLTNVLGIVQDVKTRLFYEDDYTIKFMDGNTVLLEVEEGFYLAKDPIMDVTSPTYVEGYKEFYSCNITNLDESVDLGDIIKRSSFVSIGNDSKREQYEVDEYIRPHGTGTKIHRMRVHPLGKITNG